jgi:hypothetical protein
VCTPLSPPFLSFQHRLTSVGLSPVRYSSQFSYLLSIYICCTRPPQYQQ